MKVNQIRAGTILSYLQMGISILIGICYTPIMIRLLGPSEHGLYNLASSTISMLSILSLGFGSGYVRYYKKYKLKDDQQSIFKLNGLYLTVFIIIGFIACVCGFFLSFNLNIVFQDGLTNEEYSIARVLMMFLTISLALSFPMSAFTAIISSHEKFVFLKIIGMLKTILGPLVTLPLLFMGYRSIAMVSVTLMISLTADIIYIYYVLIKLKQKFIFRGYERGLLKQLFGYTVFIAINMIVDQINSNIDNLILGNNINCGTGAISIYSVALTLYNYYSTFSTSISSLFTPRVHEFVQKNKEDTERCRLELTSLFTKVGRIQFLVLLLILTGFIFFGKPFIVNFWIRDQRYSQSYIIAVLLFSSASIPLLQNIGIEIQRAQNKHQFRSIIYILMALFNFILSIMLCNDYGALGCAIGTAISYIVANGLIMNIYYHKRCNINILYFWKNILRMAVGLIIPMICGIMMVIFVDLTNIWLFISMILIYCMIYIISMYYIAMNPGEKNIIRKIFKKGRNNAL